MQIFIWLFQYSFDSWAVIDVHYVQMEKVGY